MTIAIKIRKGGMGGRRREREKGIWVVGYGRGEIIHGYWEMDGLFRGGGRLLMGDGLWEVVHGRGMRKINAVGTKKVLDNGF